MDQSFFTLYPRSTHSALSPRLSSCRSLPSFFSTCLLLWPPLAGTNHLPSVSAAPYISAPPAAPVAHVLAFGLIHRELHLQRAARHELLRDDRRANTLEVSWTQAPENAMVSRDPGHDSVLGQAYAKDHATLVNFAARWEPPLPLRWVPFCLC